MFAGVEMSLMVAATRPAIQDFLAAGSEVADLARIPVIADEWFSKFLVAFFLGAAAGGVLFGWVGDRFGRARAMGWSVICYSAVTGFSYFCRSPELLWVLRFVACLGVGGMWPNGVALVSEAWPKVSRPMLAGLIGCAANVGFLILGWAMLVYPVTRETWRWVLLFGGSPVVLGLWMLWAVPESPAWKVDRLKVGVAATRSPVREVFSGRYLGRTLLGIALGTIPLLGGWASGQRLVPWAGQVGESLNLPSLKATTQIVQSLGAVVGSLAGGWVASGMGCRWSYIAMSAGSLGLSALVFTVSRPGEPLFFVLTFLLGVVGVSFFGWLPYYLPALFPTSIRATGTGVAYNFGRIFSALAVLATTTLSAHFGGDVARMGLATSFVYALGLVLVWWVPGKAAESSGTNTA